MLHAKAAWLYVDVKVVALTVVKNLSTNSAQLHMKTVKYYMTTDGKYLSPVFQSSMYLNNTLNVTTSLLTHNAVPQYPYNNKHFETFEVVISLFRKYTI